MEVLSHVSTLRASVHFCSRNPSSGRNSDHNLQCPNPLKGQLCSSYVYWRDASCELQFAKQCSVIKGPRAWAIHYQDSHSLYCVSSVCSTRDLSCCFHLQFIESVLLLLLSVAYEWCFHICLNDNNQIPCNAFCTLPIFKACKCSSAHKCSSTCNNKLASTLCCNEGFNINSKRSTGQFNISFCYIP
jgi:hypothetical protein